MTVSSPMSAQANGEPAAIVPATIQMPKAMIPTEICGIHVGLHSKEEHWSGPVFLLAITGFQSSLVRIGRAYLAIKPKRCRFFCRTSQRIADLAPYKII